VHEGDGVRKSIQPQLTERHPIRPDRVVHHLRWIQIQQRRPRNTVEALEQEHDRHIAVHHASARSVPMVSVNFGQTADDEKADDEEDFGEDGGGLAAPLRDQMCAGERAKEAPDVQHDVGFELREVVDYACGGEFGA